MAAPRKNIRVVRAAAVLGGEQPHLVHEETGTVAWILEPIGYLVQLRDTTHVNRAVADFIMGPVYTKMLRLGGSGGGGGEDQKAMWVADWSTMTGYDSDARIALTKWAIAERKTIRKVIAVVPVRNRVVRMGIEVAATALQLGGLEMQIRDEIAPVLIEEKLRAHPRASR